MAKSERWVVEAFDAEDESWNEVASFDTEEDAEREHYESLRSTSRGPQRVRKV